MRQSTALQEFSAHNSHLWYNVRHRAGCWELLKEFRMTFSSLEEGLARRLDPKRVFLGPARGNRGAGKNKDSENRELTDGFTRD